MRGIIHIDWIIGLMIFLVFIAFAFTYYRGFFAEQAEPLADAASWLSDEIMEFLLVDHYTVPIRFNSLSETNNSILYFNFIWPAGTKNSIRVWQNDQTLPCNISGNTIYWQANLTSGFNYFEMTFSDENASIRCNETFTYANDSVIPWAQERVEMVSFARISQMNSTDYDTFKSNMGITRDFRVELNINNSNSSYGPSLPLASNVYSAKRLSQILETGVKAEVTVLVW